MTGSLLKFCTVKEVRSLLDDPNSDRGESVTRTACSRLGEDLEPPERACKEGGA